MSGLAAVKHVCSGLVPASRKSSPIPGLTRSIHIIHLIREHHSRDCLLDITYARQEKWDLENRGPI